MAAISKAIVFIACHGGPADHFATYAETLKEQGHEVQVYATGQALKKFQDRKIEVKIPFSLENLGMEAQNLLATEIAKTCSKAAMVFTDVGHEFAVKMQEALAEYAPKIPRAAYYDNLEGFVPGGYSSTFAKVSQKANIIVFANRALMDAEIYSEPGEKIALYDKRLYRIGYYPVASAEAILERRKKEHTAKRAEFLAKQGIEDKGQKLLVYFGGNNTEYFSEAFPAFLSFLLEAPDNIVVVLQQHPGAKEKNEDGKRVKEWNEGSGKQNVILSDFSSDEAQVLADAALYYQTSMGPLFVLGGIPAIQIGHEVYKDIVVKNDIAPTATSATELANVLKGLDKQIKDNPLHAKKLKDLIFKEDWPQALGRLVQILS